METALGPRIRIKLVRLSPIALRKLIYLFIISFLRFTMIYIGSWRRFATDMLFFARVDPNYWVSSASDVNRVRSSLSIYIYIYFVQKRQNHHIAGL